MEWECLVLGYILMNCFTEYDVDTIIRIGTCGAYTTDLKLFDLLNVENSASESTYAQFAWGIEGELIPTSRKCFQGN